MNRIPQSQSDSVEVRGAADYFAYTDEIREQAIRYIRQKFDRRENWLRPHYHRVVESPLPNQLERQFLYSRVDLPLNTAINNFLKGDANSQVTDPRTPSKEHNFPLTNLSEVIEWQNDTEISLYDGFRVQMPFGKDEWENYDSVNLYLKQTQAGVEATVQTSKFEYVSDTEADVDTFSHLSGDERRQAEAQLFSQSSPSNIWVAMGEKPATGTSHPNIFSRIKMFPVETIVWNRKERREVSDDREESKVAAYLYNTNVRSHDEMKQLLRATEKARADGTVREQASAYSELFGYPTYATEAYINRMEKGIKPSYDNNIQLILKMLRQKDKFDRQTHHYLRVSEYATDYTHLEAEITFGKRRKTALADYYEQYDCSVNPDHVFDPETTLPQPTDVPTSLDALLNSA